VIKDEYFHVGIVVTGIDEAKRSLTEILGVQWLPTRTAPCPVADGAGERVVQLQTAYSTTPPFLELIEEVPGTVWVTNEYSNLHHIGFWSSDLAGDVARLSAVGCPTEISGFTRKRRPPAMYTYQSHPAGFRLEIVDDLWRPTLLAEAAEAEARLRDNSRDPSDCDQVVP
jgi:hypothetical protein